MEKARKNLLVFGLGLSLFIPFLVLFHGMDLGLHLFSVSYLVMNVILLMVITARVSAFKPIFNIWIFCFHFFAIKYGISSGFDKVPMTLLGVAVTLLIVTLLRAELLKPFYKVWMKGAHLIGAFISGLVLSILFYLVFAPVGILFRIIKKDLLDQKIDPDKDSYWIEREQNPFDKNNYKWQF